MKTYEYVVLGSGVAAGFAAQEFARLQNAPGKLAIITSPTVFKLFAETLSSVSSLVCQYSESFTPYVLN